MRSSNWNLWKVARSKNRYIAHQQDQMRNIDKAKKKNYRLLQIHRQKVNGPKGISTVCRTKMNEYDDERMLVEFQLERLQECFSWTYQNEKLWVFSRTWKARTGEKRFAWRSRAAAIGGCFWNGENLQRLRFWQLTVLTILKVYNPRPNAQQLQWRCTWEWPPQTLIYCISDRIFKHGIF